MRREERVGLREYTVNLGFYLDVGEEKEFSGGKGW